MSALSNEEPRQILAAASEFLQREVVYLDEQRWDDWLALLDPGVEYWMPGVEDRGHADRGPAARAVAFSTMPAAPASKTASSASARAARRPRRRCRARRISSATSSSSRLRHPTGSGYVRPGCATSSSRRSKDSHAFFGHTEHTLARQDESWLIARKKIVLQNDYIPTMLDFYCV